MSEPCVKRAPTLSVCGFTLIELLIVVAIIGILASIAVPQFVSFRQRAFDSAAQSDVRLLHTHIEAFYNTEGHYPY